MRLLRWGALACLVACTERGGDAAPRERDDSDDKPTEEAKAACEKKIDEIKALVAKGERERAKAATDGALETCPESEAERLAQFQRHIAAMMPTADRDKIRALVDFAKKHQTEASKGAKDAPECYGPGDPDAGLCDYLADGLDVRYHKAKPSAARFGARVTCAAECAHFGKHDSNGYTGTPRQYSCTMTELELVGVELVIQKTDSICMAWLHTPDYVEGGKSLPTILSP